MSSYQQLDKKDRTDFYIALAVIAAVLSFVIYFSFGSLFGGNEASFLSETNQEIQLDDPIVIEGSEYVPLVDENKSKDSFVTSETEAEGESIALIDSTTITSSNLREEKLVLDSESTLIEEQEETITTTVTEKVETVTTEMNEVVEEIADSVITKKNIDKESITKKPKKVEEKPIDKSCIIAVGIYKEKSNANKMLDRLKKGGYDSFLLTRRNKYQVQVYHSCNRNMLNKSLRNIRKNFASDAIVLTKK